MEKIVTLTLNPAIDKSTTVKAVVPDKKLRCTQPTFEPGGGGANVSRALKRLAVPSTAVYLAGGYSGQFYTQLLFDEGIDTAIVEISSNTRENLIVTDASNLQYRFGVPGPTINENEWKACLQLLEQCTMVDYLVASGSVPEGVPADFFCRLAATAKKTGAKLIVDTSGEPLKRAIEEGVFLLKPNLGELSSLKGVEELQHNDIVPAAREIISSGGCEIMVVSMGASGAMLITKNEAFHSPSPTVRRRSTVGAGDSMVAGIVKALSENKTLPQVLQYGIATGTATTMNPGTELCRREDVERLYAMLVHQNMAKQ